MRADRLGEAAQHRHREVAQQRLDPAGQVQHAEADEEPRAGVAAYEPVLLEGADEAVDDRAVDLEAPRQLGDGQPVGALGEHPQHPQPAVERLRGLRGHRSSMAGGAASGRLAHRPLADPVDPLVQLIGVGDRGGRTAALLAQRRVGDAVRPGRCGGATRRRGR